MFKFTQVAISKNSVVQQIFYNTPNSPAKTIKGNLQIFIQVSTGMMLFKMKEFQYGINPNDQILYDDKQNGWKLVLCLNQGNDGCWLLKINENVQMIYFFLSQRCKMIHKRASRVIIKEIETMSQKGMNKLSEKEVNANYLKFREIASSGSGQQHQQYPQNQQYQQYLQHQQVPYGQQGPYMKQDDDGQGINIIEASKSLSKGLAYAGQLMAKGLEYLGVFFAKRVQPSEAIVLSQQSKNLINQSVQGSNKLLELTTQKFGQLFRFAKTQAIKMANKVESNQQNQQIDPKKNSYKKNLLTGVHVIGNLYEGFHEGMSNAMNGIAKSTGTVVGAKYGKEAGDSSQQIIQGGRNVMNILEAPKKAAFKEFKPSESSIRKS